MIVVLTVNPFTTEPASISIIPLAVYQRVPNWTTKLPINCVPLPLRSPLSIVIETDTVLWYLMIVLALGAMVYARELPAWSRIVAAILGSNICTALTETPSIEPLKTVLLAFVLLLDIRGTIGSGPQFGKMI
jgi:hypothetical protein